MKAFVNASVVAPDHLIPNATLLEEEGRIVAFGKSAELSVPDGAEVIDCGGLYLGPGLIDIHTHAADNRWIFEDPAGTSRHLLEHGVTGVLPALYYNLDLEGYLSAVAAIRASYEAGSFRNLLGLYMEGPYLNPNFGCDREKNSWKGIVKRDAYLPLLEAVRDLARVVCIAPELPDIDLFVADVKRLMPNVRLAVAHSEAAPEQVEKYIPLGLSIGTHHTNATGTRFKYSECRGVCVDEAVNYNDEIYAELISDRMGLHVDPYMQRLVRKIKGDDRIILISDQFVCDGPVPPGYEDATDIHFDHSGEIAGSGLTLDIAARNFMTHTGASIVDAFRFVSKNPADVLGLSDLGRIAVGAVSNLVLVDSDFNVNKTYYKGEPV